ncbi:MAG: helix-turn-helix transcriptional regulator [Peptostreptococcaceae bacterium]
MLRLKRKKLMLSQSAASKILGIDNTYLSLIENKKRFHINNTLFLKICLVYQITIDELNFFLNSK